MGNNEVVGPYGSGTVFGPQAASLALVRAGVAFKATRIGQALGSLIRACSEAAHQPERVGRNGDVPAQPRPPGRPAYGHGLCVALQSNLEDIIDIGRRCGAKVLVSTVARNLKDCGPFASEHRPGLPGEELSQWDNSTRRESGAQEAGRRGGGDRILPAGRESGRHLCRSPLSLGPMCVGAGPGRGGVAPVRAGL